MVVMQEGKLLFRENRQHVLGFVGAVRASAGRSSARHTVGLSVCSVSCQLGYVSECRA